MPRATARLSAPRTNAWPSDDRPRVTVPQPRSCTHLTLLGCLRARFLVRRVCWLVLAGLSDVSALEQLWLTPDV
jgi:hypothetical protein